MSTLIGRSSLGALLCALASLPLLAAPEAVKPRSAPALAQRLLSTLGDPAALADLERFADAGEREGDLRLMAATLESASQSAKARPDVRAYAIQLLGQVRMAQGQVAQARQLADQLAFVRAWAILGPFDNDGRRGHGAE